MQHDQGSSGKIKLNSTVANIHQTFPLARVNFKQCSRTSNKHGKSTEVNIK